MNTFTIRIIGLVIVLTGIYFITFFKPSPKYLECWLITIRFQNIQQGKDWQETLHMRHNSLSAWFQEAAYKGANCGTTITIIGAWKVSEQDCERVFKTTGKPRSIEQVLECKKD